MAAQSRGLRPFPRLQKRGPIEAQVQRRSSAPDRSFHAYKSVAPLKLVFHHVTDVGMVVFPRLQKRGPIEAEPMAEKWYGVYYRFHAYKSVAPLKLWTFARRTSLWVMFPRLQKRGPIEAYTNGW